MRWLWIGLLLMTAARAADVPPPAQQSACEIAANAFALEHPGPTHIDDYIKHGFLYFGGSLPPKPPTTYRDKRSGTTFYVESDGRHVAAIGHDGKLLWVRDPFVDNNMCPYCLAHPRIALIGPPGIYSRGFDVVGHPAAPDPMLNKRVRDSVAQLAHLLKRTPPPVGSRFIGISFDTSQFGVINIANGDFYFFGQN